MRTAFASILLGIIVLGCAAYQKSAPPVSVDSGELTYLKLISRLTDLEYLATVPVAGETGAQASSWDRKSQYDAATGKYIAWDANGDGAGFVRQEGEQIVMAEIQGPGCIWRIWSARPQAGHVKIYLDGSVEPAIDLPFASYFDGKTEPFTRKSLVHEAAKGWNNYTPISFQKSCKIVADKNWGRYYHFTYSTFPKTTKVPTFKMQLSAPELAALDQADKILASGQANPTIGRRGQHHITISTPVSPGSAQRISEIQGPGAITGLRMKFESPAQPDRNVLRELAIKITWDGEKEPAVFCPLGDFFGTAPGANPYQSLPLGLTKDGWWYCYWYMPFAKSAKIEVLNEGKEVRRLTFDITHAPLTKPIDQIAYFHAKWHRDVFLPQEPERKIDWTMLTTQGRGRFVGVMLHVWNPKGGWWGEGDEKFFVDGEKFPSTFGTGSEDYFGYAWGDPGLFQNAYHNQTISEGNKGHISVNRWHIPDNVPFQKSFEAPIEKYFPNDRPCLFAATVYWYLAAGGVDPYRPAPLEQRVGYWTEPAAGQRVAGALEGEDLKIFSKSGGKTEVQNLAAQQGTWSKESHLWWTEGKPGDKLELALPVEKAGRYVLATQFTCAKDYAIIQLSLDGQKIGPPVDLYNPQVVPARPVSSDPVELTAGEHKLVLEIIGANPAALKAYMVGLDYVKLQAKP